MANKQIQQYTAASSIDGTNDLLLIYNAGTGTYLSINRKTYLGVTAQPADISTAQTLSNKIVGITNSVTQLDGTFTLQNTADNTKQALFSLSGITTGTTRTYTLPNASDTLVALAATQTLTNKTITSPTITGGSIDNSTITVDSIAGHTTPTTGTIYGLGITTGVITGAASVSSAALGQNVIPSTLVSGTGSSWALQSYTPTFTNFTIGNGTVTARYIQIGKTVFYRGLVTLGNTSSMGTNPTLTLPVPTIATGYSVTGGGVTPFGAGSYQRNGSGFYLLNYFWNSTTTAQINAHAVSTYITFASVTATVPATWANTDTFSWYIVYEAA